MRPNTALFRMCALWSEKGCSQLQDCFPLSLSWDIWNFQFVALSCNTDSDLLKTPSLAVASDVRLMKGLDGRLCNWNNTNSEVVKVIQCTFVQALCNRWVSVCSIHFCAVPSICISISNSCQQWTFPRCLIFSCFTAMPYGTSLK